MKSQTIQETQIDFMNDVSSKSDFNETAWLTNTTHEIGTTTGSVSTSDKGKSDDWWHLKDSGDDVSRKAE
jgi:hypothetical protein